MSRAILAQQALSAAGRVRLAAGKDSLSPICIYDLLLDHYRDQVELRFQALPSLEGMYSRAEDDASVIVVSSLRPSGRQRFTCAHELGHHIFQHGTRIDELIAEERPQTFVPEEFLADTFAAFLLMPKLALLRAFTIRGLKVATASSLEIYRIACLFGVGYTTLVNHLSLTLRIISSSHASVLLKASPKQIRLRLLGADPQRELHLVDTQWGQERAVDVSQGDLVLLPQGTITEGGHLRFAEQHPDGLLFEAVKPGIDRMEHHSGWSSYARIERHEYAGRGVFRHEEECDD